MQPYLASWIRYDPRVEIGRLAVPILVVQGTADLQAQPTAGAELAQLNPRAELLVVDGMNHVLKIPPTGDTGQLSAYTDPSLPIPPAVPDSISRFIRRLPPKRIP